MKFLDALLGRSKPVPARLDALFALPSAAVTLETEAGFVPSGQAGVCFKPVAEAAVASSVSLKKRWVRRPGCFSSSVRAACMAS